VLHLQENREDGGDGEDEDGENVEGNLSCLTLA